MDYQVGTYYILVKTLSGVRADNNYWLNVTDVNHNMYVYNGNVYFTNPGESIHYHNGKAYITKPGEIFYKYGSGYIASLKSTGITINGSTINTVNKKISYGQGGNYLFIHSISANSKSYTLQEVEVYGRTRIAIEFNVIGYIAQPYSPSPTGYFYYNTYDTCLQRLFIRCGQNNRLD